MKNIIRSITHIRRDVQLILNAANQPMGKEFFDLEFYNEQYNTSFSLKAAVRDFAQNGWKAGKNPSPYFNTNFYLQKYPDITKAGINPLVHYILNGKAEKRLSSDYEYLLSNHAANLPLLNQYKENVRSGNTAECCVYCEQPVLNKHGIFYFGNNTELFNNSLLSQVKCFNDELVFLVTYADKHQIREGIYSMNSIIEMVGNVGNIIFKKEESLVRCDVSDYEKANISNDYEFTNFLFRNCVMGAVIILNHENDTILNYMVENPDTDAALERFDYISKNYRLKPDVLMEYYRQLVEMIPLELRNETVGQLLERKSKANPRIVISLYAFSNGGGEVAPVRLANELFNQGIPVAVHSLNSDREINDIRGYLDPGIPVFFADSPVLINAYVDQLGINCINTHHCSNQVLACEIMDESVTHVATTHGLYNDMTEEGLEYLFDKVFQDKIDYWTYVSDKNLDPFIMMNRYSKDKFFKIVNGIKQQKVLPVNILELNIPSSASIICLASRARVDKGWYEAIEAVKLVRERTGKDIRLLLVGNGEVFDEIKDNHASFVYPVGFQNNVLQWFKAADICILPTYYKGESFPLTLVEALECEKPIIATDIGDVKDMLTLDGQPVGELLHLDKNNMVSAEELAEKIEKLIIDRSLMNTYSLRARKKKNEYSIEKIADEYLKVYCKKQTGCLNEYENAKARMKLLYYSQNKKELCPKVSIIVPNYNYEQYLKRRLDSIYYQTYKNFEVILLDDVSNDNSRNIMMEYYEKYPEITKICFNEKNKGVFGQWKNGMKMADGDIYWIAEADDWCESDFLEVLVPKFLDKDVRIAFGKYIFAENEFVYNEHAYADYLSSIDKNPLKHAYIHEADYEVEKYLSRKNTLVNASGLLFRAFENIDEVCDNKWEKMKICGDWEFYLKLLHGGKIAFDPDAISYFRIMNKKQESAGSSVYTKEIYFHEHEYIAELLRGLYQTKDDNIIDLYRNLMNHCNSLGISEERKRELIRAFDLQNVLSTSVEYNVKINFREMM